jgi:LPXTG-motif cell wall-anchored protein
MYAIDYLQETGPNTGLGWLLYLIIGLLLIAVIFFWLVGRRRGEQVEASPAAQARPPRNGRGDDLTRIEGIGPKVSQVLNQAGFSTFEALANANPSEVQEVLNAAGLQMMNPEGWIEQARLAAAGDWAALEKLQGDLKGGRRE